MPATRVAHKFSGTWLLISVYSLIRHYERPAPSQRSEERNTWIALLAIRRADARWTWTRGVKCAKWLGPFLPFWPANRALPTRLAHRFVSAIFFPAGSVPESAQEGKKKRTTRGWRSGEKRSERLERMREMRGARRLLAPSDVRLARVLVAHDSSHLGKSWW